MSNATYVQITAEEMEATLTGFAYLQLEGTRELVLAKRVDLNGTPLSLRVFTSIEPDGLGRGCGEDAIRVELATRLADGSVRRVGGSKRVNRVPGWQKRLRERVDHWQELLGPACPRCGGPTRERNGSRSKFWGCVRYPDCRGTVSD